ncbi:MAG: hypothetical protein K0R57_4608 [Paenibacillaceae bacterium]|jgi:diguanylate cyclase (GGDEF)-like protein|nr:hypothetical protein [Paenibacillaceae bacterium]
MTTGEWNSVHAGQWNRRYLNCFWYILFIAVLTGELNAIVRGEADVLGQLRYVIIPAAINFSVLGIAEWLFRRRNGWFHFVILAASTLVSAVLISAHYTLDYIQALWILPVMMSVYYFRRKLVFIATALNISAFWILTFLHPGLRERTRADEWLTMPVILLVAALIALNAMERGIQLLKELRMESEDKQELMIQNVIKDQMVRLDSLTGLYNRAALNEHLDMLLRYAESEGFSLHVAMLDVDHFKSVNDTYGHQTGDKVLRRMATAVKEGIGSSDFAARYGGEEFTIVFTDRTVEEVKRLLEGIRRKMEWMVHPELGERRITISIGLCPYGKGMARERLIEQADACLYKAKRTGRNKLCDHL